MGLPPLVRINPANRDRVDNHTSIGPKFLRSEPSVLNQRTFINQVGAWSHVRQHSQTPLGEVFTGMLIQCPHRQCGNFTYDIETLETGGALTHWRLAIHAMDNAHFHDRVSRKEAADVLDLVQNAGHDVRAMEDHFRSAVVQKLMSRTVPQWRGVVLWFHQRPDQGPGIFQGTFIVFLRPDFVLVPLRGKLVQRGSLGITSQLPVGSQDPPCCPSRSAQGDFQLIDTRMLFPRLANDFSQAALAFAQGKLAQGFQCANRA